MDSAFRELSEEMRSKGNSFLAAFVAGLPGPTQKALLTMGGWTGKQRHGPSGDHAVLGNLLIPRTNYLTSQLQEEDSIVPQGWEGIATEAADHTFPGAGRKEKRTLMLSSLSTFYSFQSHLYP